MISLLQKCPRCKEPIRLFVRVCPQCGQILVPRGQLTDSDKQESARSREAKPGIWQPATGKLSQYDDDTSKRPVVSTSLWQLAVTIMTTITLVGLAIFVTGAYIRLHPSIATNIPKPTATDTPSIPVPTMTIGPRPTIAVLPPATQPPVIVTATVPTITPTPTSGLVVATVTSNDITYANISPYFTNVGMSSNDTPKDGNLDSYGSSFSLEALANVGIKPNTSIQFNGAIITIPPSTEGSPDNIVAHGQIIGFNKPCEMIIFIATATQGPSTGTFTITYSNGSQDHIDVTINDWLNADTLPVYTISDQEMLNYNNAVNGKISKPNHMYIIALPTKTVNAVQSLTLPTQTNRGQIHIFAMGSK